nr:tape measure protein [Brucella anthropi]
MATDREGLLVTLEARTAKLERDMARGRGIVRKRMSDMERDVQRSANRIDAAMSKLGGGAGMLARGLFAGVSLAGAQQLMDASTRITNALKVAGLEGDELKKVYDSLFQSAQRNAAPMEALVTLYGRASLVQKELNVSTAELLNFTDKVAVALRVSGQSAAESSGALLQLSQALGSGIVRAEEFNSVLEGALPIAQAAAAGLKEAGGSVAKFRQLVVDGKISSEAFFKAFEAGSVILEDKVANAEMTVSQGFVRLQNVLIDAAGKFDGVSGASRRTGAALEFMSGIVEGVGNAVRNFADSDLGRLADQLYNIMNPIDQLTQKLGGLKNLPLIIRTINESMFKVASGEPINTPKAAPDIKRIAREALGSAGKAGRVGKADKPVMTAEQISDRINEAFASGVKAVSIDDYPVTGGKAKGKKSRSSGSKTVQKSTEQKIDSDIQAIRDRTDAMRLEAELVGKSVFEQERRRVAIDLEQAALAKLRDEAIKKGQTDLSNIKISSEQRAQIDEVSAAYARQAEELRKVEDTQQRADQAANDFYETFKSSSLDAITGANSLADALENILKKLADLALSSAFDSLFKPASGGVGGGAFGNIFSSIGNFITGKYANGTNYARGGLSLVGERGPELVNLPRGAQVIPNHKLMAPVIPSTASIGGTINNNMNNAPTINVNVNGGGLSKDEVRVMVQGGVKQGIDSWRKSKSFALDVAGGLKQGNPRGYLK